MSEQKPNIKNTPFTEDIIQKLYRWSNWLVDKVSGLIKNWEKLHDITSNNFELGQFHLQNGNITDAIFRFRLVTWFDPKQADAWFLLGTSYMADNKMKKAQEALRRVLDVDSNHEEARYMLAIAKGTSATLADMPRRMPIRLAKSHFDSVAAGYESEQLDEMFYKGHLLVTQAVREILAPDRVDYEMVELGVGTGLCGPLIHDKAARLVGVDISSGMLEEAVKKQDVNGKKIYDVLLNKEIHEFLEESPNDVTDMVFSASAFSYVGELQDIFIHVARVLRAEGGFVCMVDSMPVGEMELNTTLGRYRFSKEYLESLASTHGLNVISISKVFAYPEHSMWLCVFKK